MSPKSNARIIVCSVAAAVVYLAAIAQGGAIEKRQVHFAPQYQQKVLVQKKVREHEKPQDLTKIPGVPGVDYPLFRSVPPTSFHCGNVPVHPGMYANVETGCQAYHVCHDGREGEQGASFLCSNGTLFNQKEFTCDWWYNVNCAEAPQFYSLNADPLKNPYAPKPKPLPQHEELLPNQDYYLHKK